jgi:hypothetical protein
MNEKRSSKIHVFIFPFGNEYIYISPSSAINYLKTILPKFSLSSFVFADDYDDTYVIPNPNESKTKLKTTTFSFISYREKCENSLSVIKGMKEERNYQQNDFHSVGLEMKITIPLSIIIGMNEE